MAATEIYHWLDENGIPNFSQERPDGNIPDVSILYLEDTTPSDYDPEEDRYGVQAQAERINALRDEMEQRRNAIRERQQIAAQQQPVQYREPVPRLFPWILVSADSCQATSQTAAPDSNAYPNLHPGTVGRSLN